MIEPISTSISILALAASATTVWLTFFQKGKIKMTQPTTIFFGPDGSKNRGVSPKVYLRTLLFSTAKRGRVIESMHVSLTRNESRQNFPVWIYGDDKLVRGSGLFVGEDGIAANHHFLTLIDESKFEFAAGRYHLSVYAKILGEKEHRLLFRQELEITGTHAAELKQPHTGIYFDWGPDASRYLPYTDKRTPEVKPEELIELLQSIYPQKDGS